MRIDNNCSISFNMRFNVNKAYMEVLSYAKRIGKYDDLKQTIRYLEKMPGDVVTITHGVDKRNKPVSVFSHNGIEIINIPYDNEELPVTSYNAIAEMGNLGGIYKTLINKNWNYRPMGE